MTKLLCALFLVVIPTTVFGVDDGRKTCSDYWGSSILTLSSFNLEADIAIGFVGNGVTPYKYVYTKLEGVHDLGCEYCLDIRTSYEDDDEIVDVRISIAESERRGDFKAKVYYWSDIRSEWSLWHSNLTCIDWGR